MARSVEEAEAMLTDADPLLSLRILGHQAIWSA